MTKLVSEIRYKVLKIITFILSKIIGTKNVILFESNSDFCDNSKALFDYMIKIKLNKKYKIIWFVRNDSTIEMFTNKYENVYFKKFKYTYNMFSKYLWTMIYYFSIAKYAFYSHDFIGGEGNKKQKIIYLMHGAMPLKFAKGFFGNPKHNDYIIATSEFAAFYTTLVLEGGEDRFQILGYPRNDQLFFPCKNIDKIVNLKKYKKTIIWMPTFKHINNNKRNDFSCEVNNDISLLNEENLEKINKKLKSNNMLLIIKFHPAQDLNYVNISNKENIINISNDDLIKNGIDLYSLIGATDALITDFSSVYMDYLLLNKPIGFELGDKEKYENGIGFTFDNPLEYMPGEKIYNIRNFLDFIDNVYKENDKYQDEREKLCNNIHKFKDGNSSKRIVDFLKIK